MIDYIDICTVDRQTLRSRLTTVPQDPIITFETVRENLMDYDRVVVLDKVRVVEVGRPREMVKDEASDKAMRPSTVRGEQLDNHGGPPSLWRRALQSSQGTESQAGHCVGLAW